MSHKPPRIRPVGQEYRHITTTQRGYGWQWQKLRKVILAQEPLCRFCKADGKITAAEEVDHIDGESFNNERENLRPLCRPCHLKRTARDQAFGKHQWRPDWLKPSTIPLVIVCGAPASGKSSYVVEHAGPVDLVIDLDVIASQLSGQPIHGWDRPRWLTPAIRARNEMLGDIMRPTARWPRAWLIVSEAKPANRQWWEDTMKPERIIVMETPPAECIARVKADSSRPRDMTFEAIGKWWSAYERREGDKVIRP